MAILNATVVNGVSGNWWKTVNIYVAPDFSQTRVTSLLYATEGASVSGGAIASQDIIFSGSNNPVNIAAYKTLVETAMIAVAGSVWSGGSVVAG